MFDGQVIATTKSENTFLRSICSNSGFNKRILLKKYTVYTIYPSMEPGTYCVSDSDGRLIRVPREELQRLHREKYIKIVQQSS